MRSALVQLSVGDDPAQNLLETLTFLRVAADGGADLVLTPECTNLLSSNRVHQRATLRHEEEDATLAALRAEAAARGIWLLIGSLGVLTHDADGRFANRSFLIGPDGGIAARYDKIHMFDVTLSESERYRESDGFRPGNRAVVADTPFARIGLSICYDLRFPQLYRALAGAGAQILTVPAAFAVATGRAHWEVLLRARAIETGAFVLAPAQCGTHPATTGRARETWGHSLAVAPWGEVLADAGDRPGVALVDLDLDRVAEARGRVPSLSHDRDFGTP